MLDLQPVQARHLSRAPLALVLAQVRFSPTPDLVSGDTAAAVRAALGDHYPDAREERQTVTLTLPDGSRDTRELRQWILRDVAGVWTVTVAEDFVALHTVKYDDFGGFRDRLDRLLWVVADGAAPAVTDRVGLRYVDRLVGDDMVARLPGFIRESLHGAVCDTGPGVSIMGQMIQTNARVDDDETLIRAIVLPANGLYDVMVPPVPEPSWVLDVDAFTTRRVPFDSGEIAETVARLADRAYSAFRWAVTEEFLKEHE